ncbi:unnamed protein product [Schistosoma curassoni]|uniref:Late endosomal/lysosomal adaptor and MAPK and MTOR activator 1 n=1 Tax=Schistosoma curassoni TaxID=6186 RepID=A0A183JMW9_9TREM|nr:unnamed protein product [Schistosoma curassoni]
MVMGSTAFPHKRIHKATWISSYHTTQNKITMSMEDMRIRRGANIASDHHLPDGCQDESEAKEAMDNLRNRSTNVQHSLPSTYGQAQSIQNNFQQQISSVTIST